MKTPHNHEAERAVLAGIMLRNEAMTDLVAMLGPDDFHHPANRATWSAAAVLHDRRKPIDPVTLEARLRETDELGLAGGLEGLGKLSERYASSRDVAHHAQIVADVARRRRLVAACRDVAEQAMEGVDDEASFIETAERQILAASERHGSAAHLMPTETVFPTMRAMVDRMKRKDAVVGVPSGITDLDHMIGGFQPGKLYVIAGRPGHGKSAFAGNVALNAATMGHAGVTFPSLMVNLEMGPAEIIERHVWTAIRRFRHEPGIHERARAGKCTETDMRVMMQAADRIHKTKIAVIDGVGMTSADASASIRRWRNGKDCGKDQDGLGIVDYLQLLRPPKGKSAYNREQEVAAISREMKILAKETNLPILLLCQLNRAVEDRAGNRPMMRDLRESGAIEQDADVIIFVHRPCKYMDETSAEYQACVDDAELIVAKQRGGETGIVGCRYYGPYLAFENSPRERDAA